MKKRCAIYTRKSSEEGLEQEFNSLHAQREACAAYITSQKHEGWELLPVQYDDGGFSGGNMERPALKQLMEDIENNKVDVIVVYKVDRLTRSLTDFSRLVDVMDKKGVSFVSITQQFNTTTSMGRLTLNVLLSFAQFEREVTGERIRDKIALSKQKGKWMGGIAILGYKAHNQKLVINEQEAAIVRHLFTRYLALKTVNLLKAELDAEGYHTAERLSKAGKKSGGLPFSKGNLYRILQSRIYIGEIPHKDKHYPGEHLPIIAVDLFNKVQKCLADSRICVSNASGTKSPCLLAGKLFDDKGNYMSPKHSRTHKRHYRYYTSQAIIQGRSHEAGSLPNIPAHEAEQVVKSQIYGLMGNKEQLQSLFQNESLQEQGQLLTIAANLKWNDNENERLFIRSIISRIVVSDSKITITLCASRLIQALKLLVRGEPVLLEDFTVTDNPIVLSRLLQIAKVNNGSKVVIGSTSSQHNPQLVKAITRSFLWHEQLINGEVSSMKSIQEREEMASDHYLAKIMKLRFLSPHVISCILDGSQPEDWTVQKLFKVETLDWKSQHQILGLAT